MPVPRLHQWKPRRNNELGRVKVEEAGVYLKERCISASYCGPQAVLPWVKDRFFVPLLDQPYIKGKWKSSPLRPFSCCFKGLHKNRTLIQPYFRPNL